MGWRRRLADRLAAAAGDLLADVLDHLPAARHAFQARGDVLAQPADRAAALGASTRRLVEDPLARQVLRQGGGGPACRRCSPGRSIVEAAAISAATSASAAVSSI